MKDKTILVIEDTPMNMELVSDLLEMSGYRVLRAETGESGIELARTQQPDLVLMDISLPGIDGLAATRILNQDPRTRDVPVVALTAHAMQGDEQKALDAGCTGFIAKPIDTRHFSKTIAGYLKDAGV